MSSLDMGHWGTCPLEFASACKFCSRSNYGCAYLSTESSYLEVRPSKSTEYRYGFCNAVAKVEQLLGKSDQRCSGLSRTPSTAFTPCYHPAKTVTDPSDQGVITTNYPKTTSFIPRSGGLEIFDRGCIDQWLSFRSP